MSHCARPSKMDGSCWRVLTKRVPLEKGIANHFRILALRPWEPHKEEALEILRSHVGSRFNSIVWSYKQLPFVFLINLYWSTVGLQCCVSFCCIAKWISIYTFFLSFLFPRLLTLVSLSWKFQELWGNTFLCKTPSSMCGIWLWQPNWLKTWKKDGS